MTIIGPVINPIALGNLPLNYARIPEVDGFTYRTGMTYQGLLESMREWLTNTLPNYLTTSYGTLADTWTEDINTVTTAVNTALAAQATTVNTQLAATLAQIISGANTALNDGTIAAALQAATSASRTYLDNRYDAKNAATAVQTNLNTQTARIDTATTNITTQTARIDALTVYQAPAPLGGGAHDVVAESLANSAATTGGRVQFAPGTYLLNISTPQSFFQPVLRGSSLGTTTFKPYDGTLPTLKFQGGSGGFSGGHFENITFDGPLTGTGTAAVELADCCDVTWNRVRIKGAYTDGIRFKVSQPAGFCEFNRGEASINIGAGTAIHYVTNRTTQTSFHGSGITDGVINYTGASAVLIDNYCLPYNAPLSVTFFSGTSGNTFIRNNYAGGTKASFYGTLRSESGSVTWGDIAGNTVYYVGRVTGFSGPQILGNFYLAKKVYYTSGGVTTVDLDTAHEHYSLAAGTTQASFTPLKAGESAFVTVNIIATNYAHQAVLLITQNAYNATGGVTSLKASTYINTTAAGDPTYAWSNGGLQITNANYTSGYTAYVTVVPSGANTSADKLGQN